MNTDNFKQFLEVVSTVIDFYRLFEKSTDNIIEVWAEKLEHIRDLPEILDLQHKQKFYQKIWKDEQIFAVLNSFSQHKQKANDDMWKMQHKKIQELSRIDQALHDADSKMQQNLRMQRQLEQRQKNKRKKKNKTGKKQCKGSGKKKEESGGPNLSEIQDVDELISIINNDHPGHQKKRKGKAKQGPKQKEKSGSPAKEETKLPGPEPDQENDGSRSNKQDESDSEEPDLEAF